MAREAFASAMGMAALILPTYEDEVLLWNDASAEDPLARITGLGVPLIVLKQGPGDCLVHGGTIAPFRRSP